MLLGELVFDVLIQLCGGACHDANMQSDILSKGLSCNKAQWIADTNTLLVSYISNHLHYQILHSPSKHQTITSPFLLQSS
jgi:hypothetical protein